MDISIKQEKWRQERPLFEAEFIHSHLLPFFNFNESTGDYEIKSEVEFNEDEDRKLAYEVLNTGWVMWLRAKRDCKAQAVQQWISVQDRMPEQGQKVLVFRPYAHEKPYKDPNYKICTYAGEDIFINSHFEHEITHWMPLPKPPTKECK